jgi:hypothetical protein
MKANPEARARVTRARELARIRRAAYETAQAEACRAAVASTPETAQAVRKLSRPRVGPRMRELRDIVSAMPGCSKSDALRVAGLPTHGMGSGRELNRAIAAGLVLVEHERANLCRLFATDCDRRWWHLRQEALRPGTSPERIAEIRAELDDIERQRAASWTEA